MKICIIAPTVIPILGNKQQYGGIELVVALAAEELVQRGHDVRLFASGDSKTSAKLVPVVDKAVGQGISFEKEKALNRKAYQLAVAANPDVIWDNTLAVHAQIIRSDKSKFVFKADIILDPLQLVDTGDIPVVQTLHGPAKDHLPGVIKALSDHDFFFVSISHDQAKRHSHYLNNRQHLGTVYNAVDTNVFEINKNKKEDYLIWVGRYGMEKGAHIAIEVAHKLGIPFKLVGKLSEKHEKDYFNKFIEPRLRDTDEVFGIVSAEKKRELMSGAMATLMTNLWPEPFGLVAIESMASGTPVVAPSLGSLTEVIGNTGVLIQVDDLHLDENETEVTPHQEKYIDRIVEHVLEAKKIPPELPRERVEKIFSIHHNVDGYEEAFSKAMYLKEKEGKALLEKAI